MIETIEARRRVWIAELDALARRMDEVEARIDQLVAKLLPKDWTL